LYFSKLPDGQVTGIDLNSLVTELVNEQEASSPSMGFDAKLESGLPQAAAATEPIRHVVRSLFANVQEATEGKGTIYISTGFGKTKDKIVLVIEDSGPGLSPEQMERAMKPFYTTKISGTGLGLPLARQIMERSGGKLELSAGRKGLRVTLTFPVHA
jgi:two-component system NtrC family sensor kinase